MLAHVGLAILPVLSRSGRRRGAARGSRRRAARRRSWRRSFAESAVSALKFAHTVTIEELGAARPLLQGAPPRGAGGHVLATVATGIGLVGAACCSDGSRRAPPAAGCDGPVGVRRGLRPRVGGLCFVLWFFYDRTICRSVVAASLSPRRGGVRSRRGARGSARSARALASST
jgi:hypothetical protein